MIGSVLIAFGSGRSIRRNRGKARSGDPLTEAAISFAVPQLPKGLLPNIAYAVIKARVDAPSRRDNSTVHGETHVYDFAPGKRTSVKPGSCSIMHWISPGSSSSFLFFTFSSDCRGRKCRMDPSGSQLSLSNLLSLLQNRSPVYFKKLSNCRETEPTPWFKSCNLHTRAMYARRRPTSLSISTFSARAKMSPRWPLDVNQQILRLIRGQLVQYLHNRWTSSVVGRRTAIMIPECVNPSEKYLAASNSKSTRLCVTSVRFCDVA